MFGLTLFSPSLVATTIKTSGTSVDSLPGSLAAEVALAAKTPAAIIEEAKQIMSGDVNDIQRRQHCLENMGLEPEAVKMVLMFYSDEDILRVESSNYPNILRVLDEVGERLRAFQIIARYQEDAEDIYFVDVVRKLNSATLKAVNREIKCLEQLLKSQSNENFLRKSHRIEGASSSEGTFKNNMLLKTAMPNFYKVIKDFDTPTVLHEANAVLQTNDGCTMVCGRVGNDIAVIKFSQSGNFQWQRKVYANAVGEGLFNSFMIEFDDGSIILSALTETGGTAQADRGRDILLVKLTSSGDEVWVKVLGEALPVSGFSTDEYLCGMQRTADGGFAIAGYRIFPGVLDLSQDIIVFKLNVDAQLEWVKSLGKRDLLSNTERCYGFAVAVNQDFLLTGYERTTGSETRDFFIARLNATGDKIWTNSFGGVADDIGYAIQGTQENEIIVAGVTESVETYGIALVIKMDAQGNKLWAKALSGDGANAWTRPFSIIESRNNDIVITGEVFGGFPSYSGNQGAMFTRLSPMGDVWWFNALASTLDSYGLSICETVDESLIFSGTVDRHFAAGSSRGGLFLVKTDSFGRIDNCNSTLENVTYFSSIVDWEMVTLPQVTTLDIIQAFSIIDFHYSVEELALISETICLSSLSASGSVSLSLTPSRTPSPSISPTVSISRSGSISISGSMTATISPSGSVSLSLTPSQTPSPSTSPTVSISRSGSISISGSMTATISPSGSVSLSLTPSLTPSLSKASTPSISVTRSDSGSVTITGSMTVSRTATGSLTITPSISTSPSPTPTASFSKTGSISGSITITISPSGEITVTPSPSPKALPSASLLAEESEKQDKTDLGLIIALTATSTLLAAGVGLFAYKKCKKACNRSEVTPAPTAIGSKVMGP